MMLCMTIDGGSPADRISGRSQTLTQSQPRGQVEVVRQPSRSQTATVAPSAS